MKWLWLLRHAHARGGSPDAARPLSERGRREAEGAAEALAAAAPGPTVALCSPALRARATADPIRRALGEGFEIRVDDALYLAAPGTILARLTALEDTVEAVVVVAHNPGLGDLVQAGARGGSAVARAALSGGFPPAALAGFRADVDRWSELDPALLRLVSATLQART